MQFSALQMLSAFLSHLTLPLLFSASACHISSSALKCMSVSLSLQYLEIDGALVSLTFTLPVYVYAEKNNEEKKL